MPLLVCVSICVSLCLSISLFLSLSLFLCLCFSVSSSISLLVSICLALCLSLSFSVSVSLPLSHTPDQRCQGSHHPLPLGKQAESYSSCAQQLDMMPTPPESTKSFQIHLVPSIKILHQCFPLARGSRVCAEAPEQANHHSFMKTKDS